MSVPVDDNGEPMIRSLFTNMPSQVVSEEQWRLQRIKRDRDSQQQHKGDIGHPPPKPFVWRDPALIPRRQWLYGRHLIRGFISTTIARGGMGKTSQLIVDALAMTTGRDLVGDRPSAPLTVWLISTEDPPGELEARIAAASQHYGITEADVGGRLLIDAGPKAARIIASDSLRDGSITINMPVVDTLIEHIVLNKVDVLIVDPVIDATTVSENDNNKIAAVMRLWAEIAADCKIALELVHHVRKPAGPDAVLSSDDARGAGTFVFKTRDSRVINTMSRKEAEAAGIDERERRGYFKIVSDKHNLAPPPAAATWRRIIGVTIANDDEIGVVERWTWRETLFDEISTEDLREVQRRIAGGVYRADPRAGEWAGVVVAEVIGFDLVDGDAKKQIAAVIRKWVETGVLCIVKRKTETRHHRAFVEVGKWVD